MKPRRQGLQVSTFPFLAVLLCAMGSLILLLLVIDRRARTVAKAKARQAVARLRQEQQEKKEQEAQELDDRRSMLRAMLETDMQDLDAEIAKIMDRQQDVRIRISLEKEQAHLLNARAMSVSDQLAEESKTAKARMEATAEAKARSQARDAELSKLTQELLRLEQTLADLQADRRKRQQLFSVVPYLGKRGDNRKPLYLECRQSGVVLHPEKAEISGLGKSLESMRKAVEKRLPGENGGAKPYLLLLVRPDGIGTYYQTLAALQGLPVDFGYELVDAGWQLEFPDEESAPIQKGTIAKSEPAEPGGNRASRAAPTSPSYSESIRGPVDSTTGQGLTSPLANRVGSRSIPGRYGSVGMSNGSFGSASKDEAGGIGTLPGGQVLDLAPPASGRDGTRGTGGPPWGTFGPPPLGSGGLKMSNVGPRAELPGAALRRPVPFQSGSKPAQSIGDSAPRLTTLMNTDPTSRESGTGHRQDPTLPLERSIESTDKEPHDSQSLPSGRQRSFNAVNTENQGSGSLSGLLSNEPPAPAVSRSAEASAVDLDPTKAVAAKASEAFPGQAQDKRKSTSANLPADEGGSESWVATNGQANAGVTNTAGQSSSETGDRMIGSSKNQDDASQNPGPAIAAAEPLSPMQSKRQQVAGNKPVPRLVGSRDWQLTWNCLPEALELDPGVARFQSDSLRNDPAEAKRLESYLRQLVDRRQATVRPGEPPFRPLIRFRVHKGGLRTYYIAYPILEKLGFPMTRESMEHEEGPIVPSLGGDRR